MALPFEEAQPGELPSVQRRKAVSRTADVRGRMPSRMPCRTYGRSAHLDLLTEEGRAGKKRHREEDAPSDELPIARNRDAERMIVVTASQVEGGMLVEPSSRAAMTVGSRAMTVARCPSRGRCHVFTY